MKIIVNANAMRRAASILAKVVPARTLKPILQCLRLEADGQKGRMFATDLERAVSIDLTAIEVVEPGAIMIPAHDLNRILSVCTQDTVTISGDKDKVRIVAGGAFNLLTFDPVDYPSVKYPDATGASAIPASMLLRIGRMREFVPVQHAHYAICGIHLVASGDSVVAEATDGHKATRIRTKTECGDINVLAPFSLFELASNFIGPDVENARMIVTGENSNTAYLIFEDGWICTSLINGSFPTIDSVIHWWERTLTVNRADLTAAVKAAIIITSEESRSIKLDWSDGVVRIAAKTTGRGDMETACSGKSNGPFSYAINPKLLLDYLAFSESDELKVHFPSVEKPNVANAPISISGSCGAIAETFIIVPLDMKD